MPVISMDPRHLLPEWSAQLETKGGLKLNVRPASSDDEPELIRFLGQASPEDLRFLPEIRVTYASRSLRPAPHHRDRSEGLKERRGPWGLPRHMRYLQPCLRIAFSRTNLILLRPMQLCEALRAIPYLISWPHAADRSQQCLSC